MRIIIDSSILIDHLRGGSEFEDFLAQADSKAELWLSTIVIFELFSGKSAQDTDVVQKISRLLKYFIRVDFNEVIAKRAGELYSRIGKNIDPADCMVAASAIEIGAAVVTLNKKHFKMVENLTLYQS